MPLVNGKRVEFDHDAIARAIVRGDEIFPDVMDTEADWEREQRVQTEWEMIRRSLEKNHPED